MAWGQETPSDADQYTDHERERSVRLLVGLEADTDPESDAFWRMGYTYPVQLTQWALASAPRHPALSKFLEDVHALADEVSHVTAKDIPSKAHGDPLTRTGPAAITAAVSSWLEVHVGLRWNAVTGLKDGGKAKLVHDVLILPITGFRYVVHKAPFPTSTISRFPSIFRSFLCLCDMADNYGFLSQPGPNEVWQYGFQADLE